MPWTVIDELGGLASRRQLIGARVDPDLLEVAAQSGRRILRVRKGWYAGAGEHPEVLRAWRVGGRLTCISAIAFHTAAAAPPPVLHVEVPGNTPRLRDPDLRRFRLAPDTPVVVHWARSIGPGDLRAVELDHALRIAAVCGVRAGSAGQAAAVSRSAASRIV